MNIDQITILVPCSRPSENLVVFSGGAVGVIEAIAPIERRLPARNPTHGVGFSFSRVAKATSSKYTTLLRII